MRILILRKYLHTISVLASFTNYFDKKAPPIQKKRIENKGDYAKCFSALIHLGHPSLVNIIVALFFMKRYYGRLSLGEFKVYRRPVYN